MVKQIGQAWDLARSQLVDLRTQVERTARMADLQGRSKALASERDLALRALGEVAYKLAKAGKLALPGSAAAALRGVEAADRKIEDHSADIREILKEGEEAAERIQGARKKGRTP